MSYLCKIIFCFSLFCGENGYKNLKIMRKKQELKEFALWIFEQRAIDIKFYGVGCIDELVEYYLEEKYGN